TAGYLRWQERTAVQRESVRGVLPRRAVRDRWRGHRREHQASLSRAQRVRERAVPRARAAHEERNSSREEFANTSTNSRTADQRRRSVAVYLFRNRTSLPIRPNRGKKDVVSSTPSALSRLWARLPSRNNRTNAKETSSSPLVQMATWART